MLTSRCTFHRPEIHGHRGCRGLLPENTLPSFLHALALGVDVLEMDVVISADSQVVVSHEPWLNPLICLGPTGQPIAPESPPRFNLFQMPYSIIRHCDCGQLRHPGFPNQQPQPAYKPLLGEVLRAISIATRQLGRAPVRFSIELKCLPETDNIYHPEPAQFLALVLAELVAAQVIPQTTLLCFDARILQLAHQQQLGLATCLLAEEEQPWLASLQALGFVPTAFGPNFRTVTADAVQQLRTSYPGLRLVPWTVNTAADMQRLIDLRVDGITTDYPDVLTRLLV
ncbi:glycerophosphodiester phosphodiesterase family protein [Hymenobacter daeguensis]